MIKTTEYDMPDELLELADVTEAKAATQPVYNDDLAEVVNQALEHVPTVPGDGKAREMNPDLFEHATNDDVTIKDNSLTNRYIASNAIDYRNLNGYKSTEVPNVPLFNALMDAYGHARDYKIGITTINVPELTFKSDPLHLTVPLYVPDGVSVTVDKAGIHTTGMPTNDMPLVFLSLYTGE